MSTTRIVVEVTQADILNGKRGYCRGCPIALAIIRATGIDEVRVDWCGVDINGTYKSLPHTACDFIKHFDRQIGNVRPFAFELEA